MPTALGSRAGLALAYETTYGTAPTSGYRTLAFVRAEYGLRRELIENDLLGLGRDPAAPALGFPNADLRLALPIDLNQIGYWLKLFFGQPATTGSNPYTHTFVSGSYNLPSASIEIQHSDGPVYLMHTGCVGNEFGWSMRRADEMLTGDFAFIVRNEGYANSSGAGTPSASPMLRAHHMHGRILRNNAAVAYVVEVSFRYSNNLSRIDVIQSSALIGGVDPGVAALTGEIAARFPDGDLLSQARNGQSMQLTLRWERDANNYLELNMPEVYLGLPIKRIEGPGAVVVRYPFQAAKPDNGQMLTITLRNSISGY